MENRFLQIVWNILYALMYPIIMTFTLVFSALTFILSALSRLMHSIFTALEKKST